MKHNKNLKFCLAVLKSLQNKNESEPEQKKDARKCISETEKAWPNGKTRPGRDISGRPPNS